ncbi:MAG TPA: diguanylate cyclase [Longimicrobium sp.]|nr:diguanylate cyclase [Longimicrobium sp.]
MITPLLLLALLQAPAPAPDSVALDGAWLFRRGDDVAWARADADTAGWSRIPVPGEWEAAIGPYDGFGWYRRALELPAGVAGGPVGLRMGTVGDAFEVYWNGVKLGGRGSLPPRFVEGVPPALFLVPDSALARAAGGRHLLAVRVYNDYAYGGLMSSVRVGRYDVLAAQTSPRGVVIAGLVAVFLAIGVYHLAFFFRRPSARENLRFAVLCGAISLYGATYADAVAEAVMPVMNPYRLGLLALLAAGPFYVALVHDLFDAPQGRWRRLVDGGFALAFAITALLPLRLLAEFNRWIDAALVVGLLVVVARVWKAARMRGRHARLLLAGTASFSATLIYDLASEYFEAIPVAHVLPGVPSLFWIGFLVFVGAVGIATAGKWAVTEAAALVDPLTELSRRHVLEDALRRETGRLRRNGGSLAVVMVDLDHFKRINDTHGHRVGDEVLQRVGRLLRSSARNLDLPARFGGDEFAVLLYDIGLDGAVGFVERFRGHLAELKAGSAHVTASIGLAVGEHLVDPEALMEAADQAMYRAKAAGRNRVVSVVVGRERVLHFQER